MCAVFHFECRTTLTLKLCVAFAMPILSFVVTIAEKCYLAVTTKRRTKKKKQQLSRMKEKKKNHKFSRAKAIFDIQVAPNIAIDCRISTRTE